MLAAQQKQRPKCTHTDPIASGGGLSGLYFRLHLRNTTYWLFSILPACLGLFHIVVILAAAAASLHRPCQPNQPQT